MLKKFIQCATQVDPQAVRREVIDGVEHVIVSSYTLPDNIVMNGGLYPAEEISKSYQSLERTLAPVEHPHDSQGNFLSASDPVAIHNFHAGAFNVNVSRENGRVHVEKYVNVQEANKTDRGRRLMDRINELETSSNPRPIHTSTGVWLEVEPLEGPQVNAEGQEYTWIARNMVFDHDAILLDSVAAAQPHQGVGMAVNRTGQKVEVDYGIIETNFPVNLNNIDCFSRDDLRTIIFNLFQNKESIDKYLRKLKTNAEGQSKTDLQEQLANELRGTVAAEWLYVADIYDDVVIFETNTGLFQVPYRIDAEIAKIVGIPIRVDRITTYRPKVNAMKEKMLKALADAGVTVNAEITDDELLAKYNELLAKPDNDLAEIVANAVKPLADQVAALQSKINANDEANKTALIDVIVNSGKYAGLDAENCKALPIDSLKKMAANCGSAHGLPLTANAGDQGNQFAAPENMPE